MCYTSEFRGSQNREANEEDPVAGMVLRRCTTKICFHCKDCTRKVYLCSCKVFISVAVIVLGRRFSVARTEHILRLEKSWYLLLHNICCLQEISIFTFKGACVDTGMFILSWLYCILYSLTHCFLVLYIAFESTT